jgi:hypothetical protein
MIAYIELKIHSQYVTGAFLDALINTILQHFMNDDSNKRSDNKVD